MKVHTSQNYLLRESWQVFYSKGIATRERMRTGLQEGETVNGPQITPALHHQHGYDATSREESLPMWNLTSTENLLDVLRTYDKTSCFG